MQLKKEVLKDVLDVKDASSLPQNEDLIQRLHDDGMYIDSSTMQKHQDINVQKLEERLLKIGENSNYLKENRYFKANGEIKLHNDLHSIEVTRPKDLATEIWGTNNAYQTVDNNAIVCDRLNS